MLWKLQHFRITLTVKHVCHMCFFCCSNVLAELFNEVWHPTIPRCHYWSALNNREAMDVTYRFLCLFVSEPDGLGWVGTFCSVFHLNRLGRDRKPDDAEIIIAPYKPILPHHKLICTVFYLLCFVVNINRISTGHDWMVARTTVRYQYSLPADFYSVGLIQCASSLLGVSALHTIPYIYTNE